MRKEKVVTFDLNGKTKKQDNVMNESDARVASHTPNGNFSPEFIQALDKETQRILHTNPFMFRVEKKDYYGISSIEDFIVPVKRKVEMPMGELLRSEDYKKSKKSKAILKAIKTWIKEFSSQNKEIVNKVNDTKSSFKPLSIKRIGMAPKILLPLTLILLLFVTFMTGSLWSIDNGFINTIKAATSATFAITWIKIVANCGIYLVVAAIMYIGVYNSICSDFLGLSRKHSRINNNLQGKINSDFSLKSKKTLKYYKKALRGNYRKMGPLPIEETGIAKVDFTDIEKLTDAYIQKSAALRNKQGTLNVCKFILFKGSYLCLATIYGYIVYEIIFGLISKIGG